MAFIYKREQLPAYAYTGMITINADERHFVIAVASVERGMTGVRDALVTARLFESGRLNPTRRTHAAGSRAGFAIRTTRIWTSSHWPRWPTTSNTTSLCHLIRCRRFGDSSDRLRKH